MRKLFIIEDTFKNKVTYCYLCGFMVMLLLDRFYSTIMLIGLLIHSLVYVNRVKFKEIPPSILVLQSVFLISLVGTTYTGYTASALNVISKQLAIVLVPLLLFINCLDLSKYRNNMMTIFAFGCTCTVLYLFIDALSVIHYSGLSFKSLFSPAFVNHNFSMPIGLHATYFSMFLVMSIVFLLQMIFEKPLPVRLWWAGFCLVILSAGLLQLSSKAVLIALVIIIFLGFPWFIIKDKLRVRFIIISFCILIIGVFTILSVSAYRERIWDGFKNDLLKTPEAENRNWRIYRWEVAANLIKQSPVAGHGTGSELPELKSIYFERKLYGAYLNSLNVHNQYLSLLINSGIIGLVIYLATLLWGFWESLKYKNLLLFCFLVLIAVTSVSENIFDVNKGIFFYSFFFSFLVMSNRKKQYRKIVQRQP